MDYAGKLSSRHEVSRTDKPISVKITRVTNMNPAEFTKLPAPPQEGNAHSIMLVSDRGGRNSFLTSDPKSEL